MTTYQEQRSERRAGSWSGKRWLLVGAVALAIVVAVVLILVLYSGGGSGGSGGGY
jgi:hypothetical protein